VKNQNHCCKYQSHVADKSLGWLGGVEDPPARIVLGGGTFLLTARLEQTRLGRRPKSNYHERRGTPSSRWPFRGEMSKRRSMAWPV
jgi:hypothetical protein